MTANTIKKRDSNEQYFSEAAADASIAKRGLIAAFALLCIIGIGVSVQLTRIHLFVHTDPGYHSVCAMSEGVNCETVAASPYSVFAGLPVSVWGILGYIVMGGLALWSWSDKRLYPAWPWGIVLLLTAFSFVVSVVLAFISATRIDSLCLFCMGSYGINAALLGINMVVIKRLRKGVGSLVKVDIEALLSRPLLAAPLVVFGLAAIALLQVLIPSYWQTPGWIDLPVLTSGMDDSGHHWIGAEDPVLTIVEFSDYECPHCRAAHKNMRSIAAKYPDRVRLVHRQLPLDMDCHPELKRPFHKHACLFAEAAECAGLQGHFWEMNDALFSIQEEVKSNNVDLLDLAVRLSLDRLEFKNCLNDHETRERVATDIGEAVTRRLPGTPSFLIGERLFVGRVPEAEMEQILSGKNIDQVVRR